MNGLYTTNEVQHIFDHLSRKHKNLVKIEKIGNSFEKKDINAFILSNDFKNFE